jgi:hypothetical protein
LFLNNTTLLLRHLGLLKRHLSPSTSYQNIVVFRGTLPSFTSLFPLLCRLMLKRWDVGTPKKSNAFFWGSQKYNLFNINQHKWHPASGVKSALWRPLFLSNMSIYVVLALSRSLRCFKNCFC